MSSKLVARAATIAVVTATVLVTSGGSAGAVVAEGQWLGAGSTACTGASCAFTATSSTCAEVTQVNNITVVIAGCSVALSGTHSRVSANQTFFCAGVGSGTLTYNDPTGTTYPPIAVQVVVDNGWLTYRGTAIVGAGVINVQGTLFPGCSEGQTFAGTMNRL